MEYLIKIALIMLVIMTLTAVTGAVTAHNERLQSILKRAIYFEFCVATGVVILMICNS